METYKKIQSLVQDLEALQAKLGPQLKLESDLTEQLRGADQTQAYTNNRPQTLKDITVYNSDKKPVIVKMDTYSLLKIIEGNNSGIKDKIKSIKSKLKKVEDLIL